jgi:SAM-dependent methyltransferase
MRMLVDGCEERFGSLDSKKVLDIGCNDGSLLGFFRAKGAVTIGVEPTGAAEDAKQDGHNVFSEYFTKEVAKAVLNAHGKLDFITFTNVFAHIEDLDGVLQALKILMDDDTVLVIENHYLGAVLDGNQFDTFYHEHPRTYSFSSFAQMAKTLQAEILDVDFPSRYGGNIRVYIGRSSGSCVNSERLHDLEHRESAFASAFVSLQQNIAQWKQAKCKQIAELVNIHGKLRAKAFPGRAAILVKLLSLDDSMISAVYEKPGSLKIGNYLPGTRIPIKSDEELFAMTDLSQPIINLAWHIPNEIHNYLKKHHYSGPVIDVLSAQDFL